jgi:hypothetical protein
MTTGKLRSFPMLAIAGALPAMSLAFTSGSSKFVPDPDPVEIRGRLTYNGEPMPYTSIALVPAGRSCTSYAALGVVWSDGSFYLATTQFNGVLEPGRYDIYLIPPTLGAPADEPGRPQAEAAGPGGRAPSGTAASLRRGGIPTRFLNPETSGLSLTLNRGSGRIVRIDFDLRD